jgi:hypothetical protein
MTVTGSAGVAGVEGAPQAAKRKLIAMMTNRDVRKILVISISPYFLYVVILTASV